MTRSKRATVRRDSTPTDILEEANERFRDLDQDIQSDSPVRVAVGTADDGEPAPEKLSVADQPVSVRRPKRSARSKRSKRSPVIGRRVGGVAPFIRPPSRFARLRHLSGWRRQGFVPLSPGREKRRHRILPRTVIGICTMLMSAGIGAGFAGAAFYAYYDDRLAENEEQVAGFVETFDTQFADAAMAIEWQCDSALEDVRAELLPLESYVADSNGVATLPDTVGPAVWSIRSLDDAGRATTGTAFALVEHQGGSGLITDLEVVRASTVTPAPPIELVKGDRVVQATLWTWDEANGLALVVTAERLPLLDVADASRADALVGRSVFAMSGIGSRGASASPGMMIDRAEKGSLVAEPTSLAFVVVAFACTLGAALSLFIRR